MHSYKVQTKDELLLHVQHWNNDKKPKGTICIIHGLGEHQERYAHVAKFYIDNGFQVYSYDQRGHGKSEGKRGHSPGIDYNLDDLERVINTIPHHHLFLYGHSFGGNVLANFLLRKQPQYLRGAILSSPWLELAKKPNALEFLMARVMNKLAPSFTQNSKIESSHLSNDSSVCNAYVTDPLNHDKISVRLFSEFYAAGKWAIENASKLPVKTLLVHGADDAIISSKGTVQFTQNSNSLAECKVFENTKHEAHNDFIRQELFAFTLRWLEKNLDN